MFGTCLLVNLMTFAGVALVGCNCLKPEDITLSLKAFLAAFAAGALVACAVYLILVEGIYLIGTNEEYEEVDIVWRWGTAFIGGFLMSLFAFVVMPPGMSGGAPAIAMAGGAPATEMVEVTKEPAAVVELDGGSPAVANKMTMTMMFAICAGDFAHNLVDGFAIGFAFKMCDDKMVWGIVGATMYHEIAQEIGDFALLRYDVGLSLPVALAWNFLVGTSVVIGGLIAVGVDITDEDTGILLALGGGTYM